MEKLECKLDRPGDAELVIVVLESDNIFENCDQVEKTAFLAEKELENISQSLKFGSAGKDGNGGLRFDAADGNALLRGILTPRLQRKITSAAAGCGKFTATQIDRYNELLFYAWIKLRYLLLG